MSRSSTVGDSPVKNRRRNWMTSFLGMAFLQSCSKVRRGAPKNQLHGQPTTPRLRRMSLRSGPASNGWTNYGPNTHRSAALRADYSQQLKAVELFGSQYAAGVPEAVAKYCFLALREFDPSEGFPWACKTAFDAGSKQLLVEFELPSPDVVSKVKAYRFVRGRDQFETSPRPESQRREQYAQVIAQMGLIVPYIVFLNRPGICRDVIYWELASSMAG